MTEYTLNSGETEELASTVTNGFNYRIRSDGDYRIALTKDTRASEGTYIDAGFMAAVGVPPDDSLYAYNPTSATITLEVTRANANDLADGQELRLNLWGPTKLGTISSIGGIDSPVPLDDGAGNQVSNSDPLPTILTAGSSAIPIENSSGTTIDPATESTLGTVANLTGSLESNDTDSLIVKTEDVDDSTGPRSVMNENDFQYLQNGAAGTGSANAAEITGVNLKAQQQFELGVDTSGAATVTIEVYELSSGRWWPYETISYGSASTEVVRFESSAAGARAYIDQNLNELVLWARGV